MDVNELMENVSSSNAIRRIRTLQPIGGKGSYVAPPTYKDSNDKTVHVFEKRRIDDSDIQCVLLDSVQSQANRFEEALSNALLSGELKMPNVEVDFRSFVDGIGIVSSLRAPHRIFDAIIRDSELEKIEFRKSQIGQDIDRATPRNALALFHYSPTTLIFGGWNATGDRGGNGPRFQRCIVSEIVGVNVPIKIRFGQQGQETITSESKKPSSRIDPLEIEKMEIFKSKTSKSKWSLDEFEGSEKSKPSKVMHGNIAPTILDQGVTMDYAQQTTTITFAGIRRLSFPDENNHTTHERDLAAWTTLASLALCAITQHDKNGYSLRSRCDLHPENDKSKFEVIHNNGDIKEIEITADNAKKLLDESVNIAKEHKLPWETEAVKLLPQKKVVELVKNSRDVVPESD